MRGDGDKGGFLCCADLNEPWFEFPVQKDVKAQDLKAGTAPSVVGKTGTVVVFQNGVDGDQGLDDHILEGGKRQQRNHCDWRLN